MCSTTERERKRLDKAAWIEKKFQSMKSVGYDRCTGSFYIVLSHRLLAAWFGCVSRARPKEESNECTLFVMCTFSKSIPWHSWARFSEQLCTLHISLCLLMIHKHTITTVRHWVREEAREKERQRKSTYNRYALNHTVLHYQPSCITNICVRAVCNAARTKSIGFFFISFSVVLLAKWNQSKFDIAENCLLTWKKNSIYAEN